MKKFAQLLMVLFMTVSCGTEKIDELNDKYFTERHNGRTMVLKNDQIAELRAQIFNLIGTIANLVAYSASDFSDCTTGLPADMVKACQISQTANAERMVSYTSAIQSVLKAYSDELYGVDCADTVEVGCPVAGSIMDQLASVSSFAGDIATLQVDVATLQSDVTDLQNDVNGLLTRLDNFDGSGSSIEVIVSGIESDLSALESRVDNLEVAVNSDVVFKNIAICSDIVNSGPTYETILLSGDRQSITAYIETGGQAGLGLIKTYGDVNGDMNLRTTLNNRDCNFKLYEDTAASELLVCWRNTNRNSSYAQIDTACDFAGGFASPTAACTCE